jgi:hypothetical protein
MQKENHELALRFKQVLENMQEQQTQFKRLLDHFTKTEKTPKAPKNKGGGGVISPYLLAPSSSFTNSSNYALYA